MGFGNVGQRWGLAAFETYLQGLTALRRWQGVTIHHTAAPSLATRPRGLTRTHIENIRDFYRDTKGWSSGPHFFTDEDEIMGMCPLNEQGVHAVSFNATHIGIEMLGDYDVENPKTGRGKQVIEISVAATALLLHKLGLNANTTTLKFHRDDPATTKTCPGVRIEKTWFLGLVQAALSAAPGLVVSPAPLPAHLCESPLSHDVGPTVILPGGTIFGTAPDESDERAGRITVAAYPFGQHFGLDMADMRLLLNASEGEYYDTLHGRTMAILREIAPLLPGGPYKLTYQAAAKTVTLSPL